MTNPIHNHIKKFIVLTVKKKKQLCVEIFYSIDDVQLIDYIEEIKMNYKNFRDKKDSFYYRGHCLNMLLCSTFHLFFAFLT